MLVVNRFQATKLPKRDRFTAWRDLSARYPMPTSTNSEHAADFVVDGQELSIGPLRLSVLEHPPMTWHRTARQIGQSDPGHCLLSFTSGGTYEFAQSDREILVGAATTTLVDSSRPFVARATSDSGRLASAALQIPKSLLPLAADSIDRLAARPISLQEGVGSLLRMTVAHMIENRRHYRSCDGLRLASSLRELVAALLSHELRPDATQSSRLQLASMQAFIERNLADPGLNPAMVAAAHHISLRTLHRLFRAHGGTPAEWIRARRLQHCHDDLLDPAWHHRSVLDIANRWGFTDPAHFSRLFRRVYGMTPRDHRMRDRR